MIVSTMSTRHVGELVDTGKIHFSTKDPFIENGYDSQQLKEIVWHSASTLTIKSRSSLCLRLMNPPFGHERAWSILKVLPHTQ